MNLKFEDVRITWGQKIPVTLKSVGDLLDKDSCLYQAYGDSPIYGRDVLLYIGKTGRDIKSRTSEHLKTDFNRINNLQLIIGEVDKGFVQSLGKEKALTICESLLITMLKPSYNSVNIKDTAAILKGDKKYLILNQGNRGDVPLEVSNIWW